MTIDGGSGRRDHDEPLPGVEHAAAELCGELLWDEDAFYSTFYCASVTRCYPGRAQSGGGDRVPTPREQELCSFWREWELRLIRPRLIVPVGGLAVRRLLRLTSVSACVGQRYEHDDAVAIPLPHPSGASGWLNDPANRERVARAAALIRDELRRLDRK